MTTKRKPTNGNGKERPSHTVYQVIELEGDKNRWNAVGAAWQHADGKGFNIQLDLLPLSFDGRLTMRERKNNEDEGV